MENFDRYFKFLYILAIYNSVIFGQVGCYTRIDNLDLVNDLYGPNLGTIHKIYNFNRMTTIGIHEVSMTSLPEIIGSSWSLLCIYERGTQPKYLHNFPEYLFCKNGRWELHSLTNSIGQMGIYTISGNRLKMVHDGADKLTETYKLTWNEAEKYLELDNGKLIFRLRYKTKTKC